MPHAAGIAGMAQRNTSPGTVRSRTCAVHVAHQSWNDKDRPGGRPIWRSAVSNLLLAADELHPEARRAKNRPCGLAHVTLLRGFGRRRSRHRWWTVRPRRADGQPSRARRLGQCAGRRTLHGEMRWMRVGSCSAAAGNRLIRHATTTHTALSDSPAFILDNAANWALSKPREWNAIQPAGG